MTTYRDAEEGWIRMPRPTLNLGASGPQRVVYDDPAPNGFHSRPVGFATVQLAPECEPLRWEGDDA